MSKANKLLLCLFGIPVIKAELLTVMAFQGDIAKKTFRHGWEGHYTPDYYLSTDDTRAEFKWLICPIIDSALRCQRENESEAAWNTNVHGPLLQAALRGYKNSETISQWNM